jgi:endoglucanase
MRSLFYLFLLSAVIDLSAGTSTAVRVDQVGYRPAETKYAMVVSGAATGAFNLRRSSDNVSVLAGTLAAAFTDKASGDSIRTADFSAYKRPGTYYLDVAGVGHSYPFQIGEGIYNEAYYLALRSFYAQRCGTAVDLGVFDGVHYKYPVCHSSGPSSDLGSTYHPSSGRTGTRNTGKGWHDAGDYGKYIVNSGITTGQILWTYEWWADRIGAINMNIPESGNGIPDILNEARWNLEWMLTMQDTDGGVWHKNTSAGFGGMTLPHLDDAGTRYIIGTGSGAPHKSSCATGGFAAVMAIAARLFQPYDAAFAATCLAAAQSAYAWVAANPKVYYTQPTAPDSPPSVVTGAYGDGDCSDELLWAAAELFRTTGNAVYNDAVIAHAPGGTLFSGTAYPQDWANVRNMALWAYYFSGQATANAPLRTRIHDDTLAAATLIAERTNGATNGYKVSLVPPDHYKWGSNGGVANFGVFLLVADRMAPSADYSNAALNNLHYLLGRNANNVSYLTHVGSKPFQRPHHRPSASPEFTAGPPWPGLLSGGPSNSKDPAILASPQASGPIAKRWVDDTGSWATNENAINWNAPLVFLLAWTVPPPLAGTFTPTP